MHLADVGTQPNDLLLLRSLRRKYHPLQGIEHFSAFKDIEKLETNLWAAADNLRANSKLTSSDYFMPVLGIIFLRHAANRFKAAHRQTEADQTSGKMPKRNILPADYIAHRSLYLPKLVTEAMTTIESEFEPLLGAPQGRLVGLAFVPPELPGGNNHERVSTRRPAWRILEGRNTSLQERVSLPKCVLPQAALQYLKALGQF